MFKYFEGKFIFNILFLSNTEYYIDLLTNIYLIFLISYSLSIFVPFGYSCWIMASVVSKIKRNDHNLSNNNKYEKKQNIIIFHFPTGGKYENMKIMEMNLYIIVYNKRKNSKAITRCCCFCGL